MDRELHGFDLLLEAAHDAGDRRPHGDASFLAGTRVRLEVLDGTTADGALRLQQPFNNIQAFPRQAGSTVSDNASEYGQSISCMMPKSPLLPADLPPEVCSPPGHSSLQCARDRSRRHPASIETDSCRKLLAHRSQNG
ncbi:hypothetical protein [Rhizorhabdus sp. FW153]|uniref:hypothetical protein n=1 Tax=Rhizorhabdus sp. FW153 TaxID=3400216 RepID=UPI003CEC556A